MNQYTKLLLLSSFTLFAATGCQEVNTDNAANWVITADNAEQIIGDVLAFKETSEAAAAATVADANTGLRTNRLLFSGLNCTTSGTFSVNIPTTEGDPITATFTNCDNGKGPNSGTVDLSVQGFGTTFVTTSLYLDLTADNTATSAVGSLILTHDFSVTGVAYTYDLDLTLNTANGTVTVVNQPEFTGLGLNPPDSGEMLITGPNNGHIRVTAIDGIAYIDIDADRDGTFEYIGSGVPWANLQPN
ncbi:MAG: hypothetical protein OEY36_04550 [Gammaproteobacteria bacterium]|nr:hypothetical protein [Gammaproteobacteria bacterium]